MCVFVLIVFPIFLGQTVREEEGGAIVVRPSETWLERECFTERTNRGVRATESAIMTFQKRKRPNKNEILVKIEEGERKQRFEDPQTQAM